MTHVLLDTGPLVALIDRSEEHHAWARSQFAELRPPLFTCESVIAEAVYLLASVAGDATAPIDLIERGVVRLDFDLAKEHAAVRMLMIRYAPRMDLADACLVRMTELVRNSRLLTIDGDFLVYRRFGRHVIPTLLPPGSTPRRPPGRRHPRQPRRR